MVTRTRPARKKEELREKIAQKAGELFGQEGYHTVTVEQIAKSLGISKPSIYYHYGSKEEIFFEFHRIAHMRALKGIRDISESEESPDVKLRLALEYHIDLLSFEVSPGMVDLHWQFSLPKKYSAPIKKLRKEYDRLLRAIVEEGIKKGLFTDLDPMVVSFTIAGAINFLPQWYSSKGPLSRHQIKEIMVAYLMKGIIKRD